MTCGHKKARKRTKTEAFLYESKVVAICDHLELLIFFQEKSKIGGKAFGVVLGQNTSKAKFGIALIYCGNAQIGKIPKSRIVKRR